MDFFTIPLIIPIAITLLACAVASWWVETPLRRAARDRDCPIQFTLADALCLLVCAQVVLGVLHWEGLCIGPKIVVSRDVFYLWLVLYVWWLLTRMLSRAGVHVVWQRCAVILGTAVTAIGCIAVGFAPCAVVDLFGNRPRVPHDVCVLVAAALAPGAIYGLGRLTRAIVASAAKE
jgi:hypothetical protein